MTKNKFSIFLTYFFFLGFFLLTSSQNLAAQTQAAAMDADLDEVDVASPESQLTVDRADPSRFSNIAVIQGLNKITAKTSVLEIKIGDTIKFGKITITALKCWQSPLEQKPESKILLEIYDTAENAEGNSKKRIFYGWMLSSSPSISGVEHPIYDVTAIGCKNK